MYFPKHQIIPNLSTQGGELKYAQEPTTEYSGSYFKTSDGRFYTGKDSTDKPNLPLSLVSPAENPLSNPEINPTNNKTSFVKLEHNEPRGTNMYIEDVDYYRARSIKDRGDAPRPPVKSSPLPTEQEYDKGVYYRYFMKKGNEGLFIEVNLDEYNIFLKEDSSVDYSLYTPIKVIWNLRGKEEEVYNSNKAAVSLIEQRKNFYGFTLSFKGKFSKYWRS